jgi:oligoribonuclease NrnB/cAMP/cGMP phosphodiesterase (DHH superfamily)
MIQSANKLVILDHHKTAEADLKAIPDENKVFRMDHSGAYITWKYFNQSDSSVPRLITYVEDNDIWLKKQPNTREFTSYLFSMPMTFDEYEKFLDDNYIDNTVFPIGSGMMKQNESFILQGIRRSTPTFINIDGKFYFNVVLNTSVLKSELGNRVLSEYPNCDFSIMYNYDNLTNETWLSLRSDDMKADVSEIAKRYNGGGHKNSSGVSRYGFTTNLPCIVLGDINVYKLLDTINHNDNIVSLNTNYLKKELALYLLRTCFN